MLETSYSTGETLPVALTIQVARNRRSHRSYKNEYVNSQERKSNYSFKEGKISLSILKLKKSEKKNVPFIWIKKGHFSHLLG